MISDSVASCVCGMHGLNQARGMNAGWACKNTRGERVMAKGDEREVGFQDGGCFSRFLKRERINNQTFIAFLNCG